MTTHPVRVPRQQARLRGEPTYFTGRPCKHGHIAFRRVADTRCVECIARRSKINWQKRRKTHADVDRERWRLYREQNREKLRDYNRSVQSLPRRLAAQKKWRDANKEYNEARRKAYYAANWEAIRSRENASHAANREARRARDKANRTRNRDRHLAVRRAWGRRNPDKVAHKARRRRARHAGAAGKHTPGDIENIRRLQTDRCAYCRIELACGFVDHIVALAKGGSNWPSNLQLVCRPCNSSKGARDPIEFARQTGRLL